MALISVLGVDTMASDEVVSSTLLGTLLVMLTVLTFVELKISVITEMDSPVDDSSPIDEVRSGAGFELVEIVDVSDGIDTVDTSFVCFIEESVYCAVTGAKVVRTVERLSVDT